MMIVFFSYVFTDIGDVLNRKICTIKNITANKNNNFPLFKGGSQSGCQATEYEPG